MLEVASTECCLAFRWIWLWGQASMVGSEQQEVLIRRLRGRDVPILATARPSCSVTGLAEKKSKGTTKRAAMDDSSNKPVKVACAQHSKKRAALANLTNCSNISLNNSTSVQPLKSQAVTSVKNKPRPASLAKEVELEILRLSTHDKENERKGVQGSGSKKAITQQTDDSISTITESASMEVKPHIEALSTGCAEASLERKTQQNLYISRDPRPSSNSVLYPLDGQEESKQWLDKAYIDIDCHKEPQMCSAYAADIYHHLHMTEIKRRPSTTFMEVVQQEINAGMRSILVDWLVEVAEEYKLVPDTLYLTISYIDRFLSRSLVTRQQLQLLGVACMLIASKYEEICAPQIEDFCYITDNTYNREEVLEMERRVLNHLQFELSGPTTKSFLRRFVRAAHAEQKTPILQLEFLSNYLAELTLLEYVFLFYLPSMVAGAAVFLAKLTLDPASKPWNATLQHYSGYKPTELESCVKAMHDLQRNTKNCTLPAIREKYSQHRFKCVAMLSSPDVIPAEYFEDLG